MKAVLSNRILVNRTPELHDIFSKNLTYILPPRRPGGNNETVCDVTRINQNILTIPIGRLDLIPKDFELVDNRTTIPVTFPDFKFELRENQKAIYDLVNDSCIIKANPSWGKTFTGIAIASKLGQKTLVVVHNKELLNQWVSEIYKTLNIHAGIVGDSKYYYDSVITIGTFQTIRNNILDLKNKFGLVIVDECHHVPAAVFKTVLDAFKARYKIGLSATLWRKDGRHVMLANYFGGEEEIFEAEDENRLNPKIILIDSGISMPGNARIPWGNRLTSLYEKIEYIEFVLNVSEIQAQKGHLVLTIADRIEFLKTCHDILEDSMLVIGGTKERDFLASGKKILLGTGKIYAEGVNIPPLSSLVMAMPINNRTLLEQLIGRICRPYPDKLNPEVIDIVLDGATGKHQMIERINFYYEMGYDVVKL